MEKDELKSLLKKRKRIWTYIFYAIMVVLAVSLAIIIFSKDVIIINKNIETLERIDDEQVKILEIMKIESEINKLSSIQRKSVSMSKLSSNRKNTAISLKSNVSWSEYFCEYSDYYIFNSLINFSNAKRMSIVEGAFSSAQLFTQDKNFINSLLLFFNSVPYADITGDIDNLFTKYSEELKGNYQKLDTINLYNNLFNEGSDVTNPIDFVCEFYMFGSGYVFLRICNFDENAADVEKVYVSLVPLDYSKYVEIKNNNIKVISE